MRTSNANRRVQLGFAGFISAADSTAPPEYQRIAITPPITVPITATQVPYAAITSSNISYDYQKIVSTKTKPKIFFIPNPNQEAKLTTPNGTAHTLRFAAAVPKYWGRNLLPADFHKVTICVWSNFNAKDHMQSDLLAMLNSKQTAPFLAIGGTVKPRK
jgi:hypothetical protein